MLEAIDSIVIVGSTCAGKSTLVDAIRDSALVCSGRVCVPGRYITRPRRDNDNTLENIHVTPDEFDRKLARGEIALHWRRHMDSGRQERYGFPRVRAGALPVYSANNAIYDSSADLWPRTALDRAFLIGIYAPDHVRARRLRLRSPDLCRDHGAEVAYRLADHAANMIPHVRAVIDNHGALESASRAELLVLVDAIAHVARLVA